MVKGKYLVCDWCYDKILPDEWYLNIGGECMCIGCTEGHKEFYSPDYDFDEIDDKIDEVEK